MQKIKQVIVWLSRINHCRGFGIQSPWAYRFVRYVVNEHYPYHGYEAVEQQQSAVHWLQRKLGRFYLRLANSVQPANTLLFGIDDKLVESYISEGCHDTTLTRIPTDISVEDSMHLLKRFDTVDLLLLKPNGAYRSFYNEVCMKARQGTVFVIADIKKNKETRQFWREIVRLQENIVTFDLYYCGIVYFDAKRYKQHYIVNF